MEDHPYVTLTGSGQPAATAGAASPLAGGTLPYISRLDSESLTLELGETVSHVQ